MEHPAKGAGKLRADLPLLDAVQTLVEKERALMELKVGGGGRRGRRLEGKVRALLAATSTHADELEDGEGACLAHTLPSAPAPHMLSHWELLKHPPDKVVAGMLRQLRQVDISREDLGGDELDFLARALPKVGARPAPQPGAQLHRRRRRQEPGQGSGGAPAEPGPVGQPDGRGVPRGGLRGPFKQRDLQRLVLDGNPPLQPRQTRATSSGWPSATRAGTSAKLHCLRVTLNDAAPSKWAPHPAAKHYKSATAAADRRRTRTPS